MEEYPLEDLPSSSKWVNDNFILGELLGSGTFGRVYTVQCRKNRQLYALKEISQSSLPKYIAQELKIMAQYGGKCNVMNMHCAYRDKGRVFVVMDHFPHDSFKDILPVMTREEKLNYMKNLFIALEYLHSHNIIHRDVKPANFLYNRKHRKFALIDFGLSHEYVITKEIVEFQKMRAEKEKALKNSNLSGSRIRQHLTCGCNDQWVCEGCTKKPSKHVNKAGTPGFRSPEVLMRFDQSVQSPAIDIWSAGVVLLSLIFKRCLFLSSRYRTRHPIFRPADDFDAIVQICALVGSSSLVAAAEEVGIKAILPKYPGVDFAKLMNVVRPGWNNAVKVEQECLSCTRNFFGNTRGRCFCKHSEAVSESQLQDVERILVILLKSCLNPNPFTRSSATTLLLYIDDFERNPDSFFVI